jgi:hypothetical protein
MTFGTHSQYEVSRQNKPRFGSPQQQSNDQLKLGHFSTLTVPERTLPITEQTRHFAQSGPNS